MTHQPLRRLLLGSALAPLLLTGCSLMTPPTRIPLDLQLHPLPCTGAESRAASHLVVMLPGAYSRPQEFVDEGFVQAVRSRQLAVDIVIADAHMGYVVERTVLQRLHEDIIVPARQRGVRHIWLLGISLGGFVALGYAARHGELIDGIVTLAPYLGRRTLQNDIVAAGGPRAWAATVPRPAEDDLDSDIWRWLVRPAQHGRPLPVYLGFGRDDRFAPSHRLMATLLDADHQQDVPGDHDWPAWRALWTAWLDRGLLPVAAACPPTRP